MYIAIGGNEASGRVCILLQGEGRESFPLLCLTSPFITGGKNLLNAEVSFLQRSHPRPCKGTEREGVAHALGETEFSGHGGILLSDPVVFGIRAEEHHL